MSPSELTAADIEAQAALQRAEEARQAAEQAEWLRHVAQQQAQR